MKIPLRELPLKRDFALSAHYVGGLVAGLPMRTALGKDAGVPGEGTAELDFYIEGDNVFARGTLKAWVELACSRCLVNVRIPIKEQMMVTYLPGGQIPNEQGLEADGEDADEGDAEDTYGYEDEVINVEPLLRERLLLAVPYAPLCKSDCLGLCSKCGANRNESDCGCDRKVVDPRLASLKDIKV
ncbi:MAG: DUF177 domain-containing protein [Myxococcales bacterium]|nr:DUF177 domain-containing protein [Myxococcales bacterium]